MKRHIIFIPIFLLSFIFLPLFSSAQTLSDLEIKIAALLAEIQTLQTELQILKTTEATLPSSSSTSSFTTTLGKGSEGSEVTALQTYLAKDPALYPEGLISGYYGALTEAAVKRFQQKHNIVSSGTPVTTGYGVVGPKTRALLNSLLTVVSPIGPSYGSPTPTPTPVVSTTTPNRSLNLSITGDRFITLPNKATLSAIATDDGKPSATLTYLWSKAGGPGTVTFSAPTNKETTATFSSSGTYQITATVSDSDLFASYTITLIVSPSSTTATTTPPATTTPTLPAPTLTFSASQTTLTKGNPTTLTWSATNAISCTATNGWFGSKTASGTSTLTPQTTTTYSLACKGGAGDQVLKSVTVAVTGTQPQPIADAGVKFTPGFYAYMGNSDKSFFDVIKGNPDFVGIYKVYVWRDLEPSFGTYDFSMIAADMAYAESLGKKFGMYVDVSQWDGRYSPRVPNYMLSNSKYGGGPLYYGVFERKVGNGGWVPIFWNTNVRERYAAFHTALGKRFNNEPNFVTLMLNETSVGGNGEPGYSAVEVENTYKTTALAAKAAFPNTTVVQQINFADYDLKAFSDWSAANGIGLGGPDVNSNSWGAHEAYTYQKAHHNNVPIQISVEWPDYDFSTPAELLDFAIIDINPHIMMWDLTRDDYRADVLRVVHNFVASEGSAWPRSAPTPAPIAGPACNVIFASGFEGLDLRFTGQYGPYLVGVDSVFDQIYPGRSNWSTLPYLNASQFEVSGAFFNHIVGNRSYQGVGGMSFEYAYTDIVSDTVYGGASALHSKVTKGVPEAGDGNMSRMQWDYALKPDHGLERGYVGFRMRLQPNLEEIMADNKGPYNNWQKLFQLRELVDGCEYQPQPNHPMYSTDIEIIYNAETTPKLRFSAQRGMHYCNGSQYDGGDMSARAVPADGKWHHYEFFWDRDVGTFRFKLDGETVIDWTGVHMKIANPMEVIKPIYMYTSEPWEGDATRQPIERWYDDLYICDNRPMGF